jgi:hypothetical protein
MKPEFLDVQQVEISTIAFVVCFVRLDIRLDELKKALLFL